MTNSVLPQRIFIPGSEWLYFKIYTSHQHAESVLINNVIDFTNQLCELKLVEKWFFIRYEDPNPHLRLRLHITSNKCFDRIFELFDEVFNNELSYGKIWKIQLDTYVRELERYGMQCIDSIESIFYLDSVCLSYLIKQISNSNERDDLRFYLGISIIDHLFDAFYYDLKTRSYILEEVSNSFLKEFNFSSSRYTKQLNDKYRKYRIVIEQIINRNHTCLNEYNEYLNKYAKDISVIVKTIDSALYDYIIISIIHMSMNRLFISNNRQNELVLYYLVSKYYKSLIGRGKYDQ